MTQSGIGTCSLFVPPAYMQSESNSDLWGRMRSERFDLLRRYSDLHGYRCHCADIEPDDDRQITDAWWYKDQAIAPLWEDCEWVFYTDIDTHILEPAWRLERFLPDDPSVFIVGRRGRLPLQMGSFLVRTCPEVGEFLDRVYSRANRQKYAGVGDDVQAACDVMEDVGWERAHVYDPDEFEICCRHGDVEPVFMRHYTTPASKQAWLKDLDDAKTRMRAAEYRMTMGQSPPVTVVTPTYGRFTRLRRCLDCFLQQDYPGPLQMVILNDAPEPINCNRKNVTVYNKPPGTFETLGDKRQWMLDQADTPYVAHMDDDDIYLPWYVTRSMRAMLENDADLVRHHRAYELVDRHEDGSMYCRRLSPNTYEGTFVYNRLAVLDVGGYDPVNVAECNTMFCGEIKESGRRYDLEPGDKGAVGYAYRSYSGDVISHVSERGVSRDKHQSRSDDYGSGQPLTRLDATPYYRYLPSWRNRHEVDLWR